MKVTAELDVFRVVSMRGVTAQPGWYIFKRLDDEPDAWGVIDGPYPSVESAMHEARQMERRRLELSREVR